MKTIRLSIFAVIITVLASCGNKTENAGTEQQEKFVALNKLDVNALEKEIQKRREAVEKDETGDVKLAADLYEAFETYGRRFPNHENAADYLFRAGEIAMNLNQTSHALKLFETVYEDFRKYEKSPYALFMRAFVLENQANNYVEAQKYYEEFIENYPNHPMADDAEYSLKNMGKTPEELIRNFEIQDSIKRAQEAS